MEERRSEAETEAGNGESGGTDGRSPSRIEVSLEKVEQLFNSMDPSPFHAKDLDRDAEQFIVSWAQEFPRREPLSLLVHLRESPEPPAEANELVRTAVHNYFSYRAEINRLDFRQLLAQGRTSLFIGVTFLAGCFLSGELLVTYWTGRWVPFVRESLTIAGWVAMWRPMQIFLYDWWPLRRRGALFEKLSQMQIEVQTPRG